MIHIESVNSMFSFTRSVWLGIILVGYALTRLDPVLAPEDFDLDHIKDPPDEAALEEHLFDDLSCCADIKTGLSRIRSTFLHSASLGRDPLEVRRAIGGTRELELSTVWHVFKSEIINGKNTNGKL